MLSANAYVFWIASVLLDGFVCALIAIRGQHRRYFAFLLYFGGCVAFGALRMLVLMEHGWSSREYAFFYYYTDLLLTVLLYLVVTLLYQRSFVHRSMLRAVRIGRITVPLFVGIFSLARVLSTSNWIAGRLAVEYSQDLSVVSTALATILACFVIYDRHIHRYDRQLAFVVGVFFALVCYYRMLYNLYPTEHGALSISYGFWGLCLPVGVAYVFCDPQTPVDEPQIRL
jgi:hypothetical protein